MGLETGDYISNLIATNPEDTDPTHEGDDHFRLIKNVLKETFPGDGGGWNGPLTLDLDFLNGLDDTGIPGLITRTGTDPNEIVSIGQTSDDGTDVFTGGVNSFVQNWDDGGPQSATIMNATNVVDHLYPIGTYIERDGTAPDPNVQYPGTTWDPVVAMFTVSDGVWDEAGPDEITFTVDETGGEASHQLTEAELAAHSHAYKGNIGKSFGGQNGWQQNDSHNEQTSVVGGDARHNNLPPYVVVKRWKRTA